MRLKEERSSKQEAQHLSRRLINRAVRQRSSSGLAMIRPKAVPRNHCSPTGEQHAELKGFVT
jgi:hypothetical protein